MESKLFVCRPWSPRLPEIAQHIMTLIKQAAPELEVLFMGAAALGLAGKNDIDLDILCKATDIPMYVERLVPALGIPNKVHELMTIWEFEHEGVPVDAVLSDPATSLVPLQRARFEKLKSSPLLLEEYRQLKLSCDGMPYEEYERHKLAFFEERVVSADT